MPSVRPVPSPPCGRDRSERRRLQRQLRSEERGAVRELRKDAVFMAGVRAEPALV